MKQYIINLVMMILITFFLCSCSSSTETKKGIIKGKLYLEGQSDNSGITVLLFTGDIIPNEIKNINLQFPSVGFPIQDYHLFDHRKFPILQTAITSPDGSFKFTKMNYNNYIVAFFKEDWGYNYIFNVELNNSELNVNQRNGQQSFTLKPVIELPTAISGNFIFESNRCYSSNHDVTFLQDSNVEFQPDARILIDPSRQISIYGTVTNPLNNNFAYITSSSGVYDSSQGDVTNSQGIVYNNQLSQVSNIIISYQNTAFSVRSDDVEITKFVVRDCDLGIVSNQVKRISLQNCFIANNINTNSAAINNYATQELDISRCLFWGNYISIQNTLSQNMNIENNAFLMGSHELVNLWESSAVFSHNTINNEGVGIENAGQSNLEILYNDIKADVCIKTYHLLNWTNNPTMGWTKAHNNNLIAKDYAVYSEALYMSAGTPYPLSFTKNWWDTSNQNTIASLIWDFNDIGSFGDPGIEYSIIEYQPFSSSTIIEAGIQ